MSAKHTPGPWRVGRAGAVVADHPTTDRPGGGHDDADYYGGHLVAESIARIADARLIAAAPDTYDACREVAAGQLDHESPEMFIERVRAICKAAIAKAEGRES